MKCIRVEAYDNDVFDRDDRELELKFTTMQPDSYIGPLVLTVIIEDNGELNNSIQ